MISSSADMIIQNRRISQSESSTGTIGDVVNIYHFTRLLLDLPRHLDISQRMNHAVRYRLFCRGFITKSTNQASCQADGL